MRVTKIIMLTICLLLATAPVLGALTDDLNAYYDVDSGLDDSHTNNFFGKPDGGTQVSGLLGNAREYGGSDHEYDYLNKTHSLFGSTTNSFSMWFYRSAGTEGMLMSNGNSGSQDDGEFYFKYIDVSGICAGNSSCLWLVWGTGSGSWNMVWPAAITNDEWHHTVLTVNMSESTNTDKFKLYYDGVELKEVITATGDNSALGDIRTSNVLLGGEDSGNLAINGEIDEIGFWNTTLTASQVTDLNNNNASLAYPLSTATTPPPDTISIIVRDRYDNSTVAGVNVTMYNSTWSTSNLTNALGQTLLKGNGTFNFNITDDDYFDHVNIASVSNGTTTNAYIYGAFISIDVYDVGNNQVNNFTACGPQICNSTTNGELKLLLSPSASNNIDFTAHTYYDRTQAIVTTAKDVGSYNVSGLYQGTINLTAVDGGGSSINNFYANISGDSTGSTTTTNGSIDYFLLWGNYSFLATGDNYTIGSKDIELTNASYSYEFELLSKNSFNFTFIDEETTNTIDDRIIYIELISDLYSGNFTTLNGTWYADLFTPEQYTIRYRAENYTERFYIYNLTDKSRNTLDLYLLSTTSSSEVTMTVYDTIGNRLEDAYIKILRYDVTTNTFNIVDLVSTNFQGEAKADMVLNDEYYKFIIEYGGGVVLTTEPTYVYGTTLSFYVPLGTTGLDTYFDKGAISGLITHATDTQIASFTWSDSDNTASEGCLYGYEPSNGGLTLINSSCASTSTGTVYLPLDNNTATTWFLIGKVTKDGTQHNIDTLRVDFDTRLSEDGMSPFITALIIMVIVFIGFWSLEVAVLLGSAMPLLMTITKLSSFDYTITIPMLIGGVVIAIIIGVKRR